MRPCFRLALRSAAEATTKGRNSLIAGNSLELLIVVLEKETPETPTP